MDHPIPPENIPLMSPELQSLLIFLLTGLVAGWIASLVLGGGGLLRNLVIGVIGALVGGYVLKFANMRLPIENSWVNDLATAVIGALIVIVVARIIAR
jgi:uncharacterized membrane protein YeaQ/YmgE (transglycosylase-associated protein family)